MGIERVQTSWSWSGIGLDGARTHRQCHLLAGIDGRTGQLRMTNRVFINKSGWTTNQKKGGKEIENFKPHTHKRPQTNKTKEGGRSNGPTMSLPSCEISVSDRERERRESRSHFQISSLSLSCTHTFSSGLRLCVVWPPVRTCWGRQQVQRGTTSEGGRKEITSHFCWF